MITTMHNLSGSTRDMFSMVKRGTIELSRIALPWQPAEYKPPESAKSTPAQPPIDFKVLIPRNAEWSYLAGQHPRGLDWTQLGFNAQGWRNGAVAMGFGDGPFRTELAELRGQAASVYLRREFQVEQTDKITELGLMVDYRDAFIAYINGREVARVGVGRSAGRNVQKVKARDEKGYAYVALKDLSTVQNGRNVLAIEVHSANENAMDFHIDPYLLMED